MTGPGAVGPASASRSSAPQGHPQPLPLKILVVDDDVAEHVLLEDGFAHCGRSCELSSATSATLALADIVMAGPDDQPDLAIVDINMPLVSGFELAAQLLANGVPTILISNQVDGPRIERARAMGVLDILSKPTSAAGYQSFAVEVLKIVTQNRSPT